MLDTDGGLRVCAGGGEGVGLGFWFSVGDTETVGSGFEGGGLFGVVVGLDGGLGGGFGVG